MKKIVIATAIASALATGAASAGEFLMIDGAGGVVDSNDGGAGSVATTTDTRNFGAGTWTLSSTDTFFGSNWTAHSGTVYNTPGIYKFDAIETNQAYVVDLQAGYTMGHILFNWGVTADIDVVNIWDAAGDSIDSDGNALRGIGMVDGAFPGFSANFNTTALGTSDLVGEDYTLTGGSVTATGGSVTAVPVPAAVWLFGSGLLGLVGVARRKKAA